MKRAEKAQCESTHCRCWVKAAGLEPSLWTLTEAVQATDFLTQASVRLHARTPGTDTKEARILAQMTYESGAMHLSSAHRHKAARLSGGRPSKISLIPRAKRSHVALHNPARYTSQSAFPSKCFEDTAKRRRLLLLYKRTAKSMRMAVDLTLHCNSSSPTEEGRFITVHTCASPLCNRPDQHPP